MPAGSLLRAFPFLLLAACASRPAPLDEPPVRLLERAAGRRDVVVTIGDETRAVLDPGAATQTLSLDGAPRSPVLWLGLGLEGKGAPATWHAEAFLSPPHGDAVSLLDERLDPRAVGWIDRRLDLAPYDLTGATLTLRLTPVEPLVQGGRRAVWAAPVLLPPAGPDRPSVILVSLDTLRADRVGPRPGGGASRTPHLDALARESVVFTHAYSPSTWTLPSHVALLWGRHPSIAERARAAPTRPPAELLGPLAPLAETFRDAGWITAAFTGGGWMSPGMGLAPGHGFARGFDLYRAFQVPTAAPGECPPNRFDGTQVFDWATAWLAENAARPFFLFLHTYEPHDRCPFVPPGDNDIDALIDQPERRRELDAYYDELIERTDRLMGRLLDVLAASGLGSRTILAVTSDHGEALFEHGFGGHGCEVPPYEELMRVPLMIRPPPGTVRPAEVAAPVGLVQVAPTLRALAGIAAGPPADGPPLPDLGIPRGAPPAALHMSCDDLQAVRIGDHKLITSRSRARPDELYDVAADPGERTNLAGTRPEVLTALRSAADAYWAAAGPPAPAAKPEIDPELREQLRALGYVD